MKKLLCTIAAVAMLVACGGEDNLPMENTKWNLTELNGTVDELFDDADTFWFALDGESIIGVGACNRFFGGYQMTQCGSFEVGGMGMTRMACPDMELEDAFVRIMDEADGYQITGNVLTLKKGAEVLARFKGEVIIPGTDEPQVSNDIEDATPEATPAAADAE
ncbi:MAG: META domain-containing protein [Alistipes sp.]|nr:META domain-containing protein [Alistipes sp.]